MQEKCTLCTSIMMMLLLMVSISSYAQGGCSADAGTVAIDAETVCRGGNIGFSVSGYTLGDPTDGYVGIAFSTSNAETDITNGSFMNPQGGDAYTYTHDGSALPSNVPIYAYSYIGEGTPPAQIGSCNDISPPSAPFVLLQEIAAVTSDYACIGNGTAQLAIAANGGLPLYSDGQLYTVSVGNAAYGGSAQIDNNQSIVIEVADGMTWSVTFTDEAGCSGTISDTFSAAEHCPACAADAGTIAKSGNDIVCFGGSFGFTASGYTLGDEAQGYVAIVVSPNAGETNPLTGSFYSATEGDNVNFVNDGSTFPYNTPLYGYSAIGEGTPPTSYDPFCNDLSGASQPVVLLQNILIEKSGYVCTSASTANVAIAASGGMPLYNGAETFTVSVQNATYDGDNQINNGENLLLHVNNGVQWTVTLTDSQGCSNSYSDTFVAADDCGDCAADAGQLTASRQYVCFEDEITFSVSGYTLGNETDGYVAIGISPDAGEANPLAVTYYAQYGGDSQTVTNDNFSLPFNTTLYAYSYIGRGVAPSQIDPACNDLSQAVSFTLLQEVLTAQSNYVCTGGGGEVAVAAVGGMPSVVGGELFAVSVSGATYSGPAQVAANENVLLEVQDGVAWSVTFTDSQNCTATHSGTFVAANECEACTANAGDIAVSDDIVCYGDGISFSVGNYVLGSQSNGYVGVLVSPNDDETDVLTGTFYNGVEGDAHTYVNDGSKYAYNTLLYAYSFIGEGTPPTSVSECRDISGASTAFVFLQPIQYSASGEYGYDCQSNGSAFVHLQVYGGLPAYDPSETFSVSVSGAGYSGSANIANGTGVTLVVADGSAWSVSFTDAAGCSVSISDTYDSVADCGASAISMSCPDAPATPYCVLPEPDPSSVAASTACASGGVSVVFVNDETTSPGVVTRTYQATDACGNVEQCTQEFMVYTGNPLAFDGMNVVEAQCGADGSACMSVSGGVPPYAITFQGGSFGAVGEGEQFCFDDLNAGFYTIGATDAHGCYFEQSVEVQQGTCGGGCDLSILSSSNPSGCVGNGGEICLEISGGLAPYSVASGTLSVGQFAEGVQECIGGFSAGSYELLVTDAEGCTSTLEVGVGFTPASISVAQNIEGASCAGGDGSACLSFTGGTAPYTFAEGDALYPLIAEGEEICINSLPAGNYAWTVSDDEGCAKQLNINIPGTDAGECINAICGEEVYTCTPLATKVSICISTCNFVGAGSIISANASQNGGLVTVVGDYCIEYIPDNGFSGMDDITVVACSGGDCFETVAHINVGACSLPPVAIDDTQTTELGATVCTDLMLNDYDIDGDVFGITGTTQPDFGQVAIDPVTGQVCYTPNAGFIGEDTYTYTICDDDGCDEATVTVTVTGDPVCENPDNLCTPLNTPIEFCVQFCSLDASATISSVHSTYECGLEILENNCVRFTPLPGQTGNDAVEVTGCTSSGVCETVVVNIAIGGCTPDTPPIAVDDNASTNAGEPVSINVTANDQQTEGDPFLISGFSQPLNGTVTQNGNVLVYTPNAGFTGTDTFIYSICDDDGCDQATVQVLVIDNECENPSGLCTGEMETITICVSFCSLDATASITDAVGAFNCGINVVSDNCIEFTPLPGQTGTDIISITGCDVSGACETVQVDVFIGECEPCENPELVCSTGFQDPQEVCVQFCDLDGDVSITAAHTTFECGIDIISDFCLTYTPLPGFAGPDVLVITGCNELGQCSAIEIPVFVGDCDGTQTPPIAVDDFATVESGDNVFINILANDQQTEGDAFVLDGFTQPANGTVTQSGSGLVYTPNAGFTGTDSFTYTICDDDGCDTATVTVEVGEACENPDLVCSTGFQDPQTVCVQFCDLDGDVSITAAHTTFECGIDIISDLCLTYTPLPGFAGPDVLVITGCNELGQCATIEIPVFVGDCDGTQTPPIAVDDFATVESGSDVLINILANDQQTEGDAFVLDSFTQPANGTVTQSGSGLVYTPNAGFTGTDSFTYTICDDDGCDTATVTVEVGEACENPDLVCSTGFQDPQTVCVQFCDLDGDVSITAAHTTFDCGIDIISDLCLIYTPLPGFAGPDVLVITGCNELGECATVEIPVFVGDCTGNQPPVAIDDEATTGQNAPVTINVLGNDYDPDGDGVTITAVTPPVNGGTVSLAPGGSGLVYTPAPGFVGVDSFQYQICDPSNACDEAWVVVTVTEDCDPYMYICAEPLQPMQVCVNFCEIGGDDLSSLDVIHATFECGITELGGNCFQLTPLPGQNGTDTLTVVGCNSLGVCDTTYVVAFIGCTAPVAVDDAVNMNNAETAIIDVLANDLGICGDHFTVTVTDGPTSGTVVVNNDLDVVYTPEPGFVGTVTFTYTVCEVCDLGACPFCEAQYCDDATVTITITDGGSSAVDAQPDIVYTNYETPIVIGVLNNDFGNNLSVTEVFQPDHGTVAISGDGTTVTYTPDASFVGNDYFFYVVCNDAVPPQCDQTIVAVDVLPPVVENLPPMANNDIVATPEGEPVTFDVLGNDTDPNGDVLTVTAIINGPGHGTVVINPDGTLTYTPDAGYNGNDMFSYVVCDPSGLCDTAEVGIAVGTTTGTNNYPIAENDVASTSIGEPITINVLGNDQDPDGDNLTVTIGSQPIVGVATVNPDGTVTYTPPADFEGIDYFTYIICDDGAPSLCDTAYVTITVSQPVTPVNAEPDVAYTPMGEPVTINVLANDEGDGLVVTAIVTPPANGSAVLNPDGTVTYTPNPGFEGIDYFEYQICDGSGDCDVTVVAVHVYDPAMPNQPPLPNNDVAVTVPNTPVVIPVLDNDVDPEGEPLTVTAIVDEPLPTEGTVTINPDGTITFTPATDFTGCVTFGYVVCDPQGACDTAYVGVNVGVVSCTNNPPDAVDDEYTTLPGVTIPIDVLDNDTEPDGDNLTVTVITPTTSGSLIVTGEGTFDYIPEPGFTGTDYFIYTLCDDGSPVLCDTAYVTINVFFTTNVLDAQPDVAYTPEGQPVVIPVLSNDIGDGLGLPEILGQPENGMAGVNPDGTVTYTPNPDFIGIDYFEYVVCDASGDCDTTLVSVNVYPEDQPNQPPMAGNDIALTPVDTPVEIPVLDNDVDPEGQPLTITAIVDEPLPTEGTVTISPDGETVTFTPADGFEGCVTFGYVVCDPAGLCDTAYVGVGVGDVDCLNNPPVALDDDAETEPNTPVVINILGNDMDPDEDSLTVTILSEPNHGDLNPLPDGTYEYTPDEDYMGPDFFVYTICDDGVPSLCDTAYVSIVVAVSDTIPLDAEPDIATTPINTPVDIEVLDNDSGNYLDVTNIVDLPDFGTAVINPDNTVTYTPDMDYVGVDYFEYQVCDIFGNCEVTLVTVTVLPSDTMNLPPVAVNDVEMTDLDTPVQIDVLDNDFDPYSGPMGGDAIAIANFDSTTPNGGTVTLDPVTGNLVYTPAPGFTGVDTFNYTICDNGTPVMCDDAQVAVSVGTGELPNNPPVAVDDAGTTTPNVPVMVDLLGNDMDPDGDNFAITFIGEPAHGTAVLNDTGDSIIYTPNPDYAGTDFFPYIICDDGVPVLCDTAYVTITIVDDAFDMVVDVLEDSEDNPICPGEEEFGLELPFEDIESITILTPPTNGMASMEAGNDSCVFYTPLPDYFGPDTLSIIACGTVAGETVCDTIDILINVIPVPDAPIAVDDSAVTTPETPITIDVLDNDSDPDGDLVPLPVIIDGPDSGTAVVEPDGTITYTPDAGTVCDTFVYVVFDATGLSDTAQVVVCVEDARPLVDAVNDVTSTNINTPVDIPVLDNDLFPADVEPTIVVLDGPENGIATVNEDGTITYTPDNNFMGIDTFTYVLCAVVDGEELCDTAQVVVVVNGGDMNCVPVFSNFITPNGDTYNDEFLVDGLENFSECYPDAQPELLIFNRWGDIVFESEDYSNDRPWDGTWQETGEPAPDGTYFYIFRYNDGDGVQQMNGFVEVHR